MSEPMEPIAAPKTSEQAAADHFSELMGHPGPAHSELEEAHEVLVEEGREDVGSHVIPDEDLVPGSRLVVDDEEEDEEYELSEEEDDDEEYEETGVEELERLRREAYAKGRESQRIRKLRAEDQTRIDQLQGEVKSITDYLREATKPPPPEGFEHDPNANYLNQRLSELEAQTNQVTEQPVQRDTPDPEELTHAVNFGQRSAETMRARVGKESFDSAYQYVRNGLANSRADITTTAELNLVEKGLLVMALRQGVDPATEVMRMAQASGWSAPVAQAPSESAPVEQEIPQRRINRLRQGVNQAAGVEPQGGPNRRSASLSQNEFFQQYSEDQRKAIFISSPDGFDELASTGFISTRYLPG